jgi:hypothetical protein
MNHDHRDNDPSEEGSSSSSSRNVSTPDPFVPRVPGAPGYMTVGSGSTPEAAARLVSMLDDDSGYGGSLHDGQSSVPSWHSNIGEDRPSQSPTSVLPAGSGNSEHDRQRSHVMQLRYNQNKNALGRAIHGTIEKL